MAELRKKTRNRIRTTILTAFLWLLLLSLSLFGLISLSGMLELKDYVLQRNTLLGEQATYNSVTVLKEQAEKYLLQLVGDQAAYAAALLEKVANEVNVVADYASNLWTDPVRPDPIRSYTQEDSPASPDKVSVFGAAPGSDAAIVKKETDLSSTMDRIFAPTSFNDPNINTLALATESGFYRSFPWRSGRKASYDPRRRPWYIKAAREKKLIWTEPYIHAATGELIITCAKPFFSRDGITILGAVEADITLKALNDRIAGTNVGKRGYAFLLNSAGKVISKPSMAANGADWDSDFHTENLLESPDADIKEVARLMTDARSGLAVCKFDNEDKIIAYAPVSGLGWSLGLVMPIKEIVEPALVSKNEIKKATEDTGWHISKRIARILKIIGIVFLFISLLVIVVAYRISVRITRPITALHEGVNIVGAGDLDYKLDVKTRDEIEDLANAFNKMTKDLKAHITKLAETMAAQEAMDRELKIAHDIQMSAVPRNFPAFPSRRDIDIYAFLEPAKKIGGDFYDFFFIERDKLCFYIGDVSGKGVPAALFMTMVTTLLRTIAREETSPAAILTRANVQVCVNSNSPMFVTVFLGVLDVASGKLIYANGGHNPPIVVGPAKPPAMLEGSSGSVLGVDENIKFSDDHIDISKGDSIFLYTDGVTEMFNTDREMFTMEKLKEEVFKEVANTARETVKNIIQDLRVFSYGAKQSDDLTILAIKYKGKS